MQALWRSLHESTVTWKPVHVYGHQDCKVKDSHRRLASLNCQMDALAKQHWAFLFKRLPSLASPYLPIHNEGWTLWNGPSKIPPQPAHLVWPHHGPCHPNVVGAPQTFPLGSKGNYRLEGLLGRHTGVETQPPTLDHKACLSQLWCGHHACEMEAPG